MKFCVQAQLVFQQGGDFSREQASQFLDGEIPGRTKWGIVVQDFTDVTDEANIILPALLLEVRFESQSDMDEVYSSILTNMQSPQIRRDMIRWTASKHECTHDESPPSPCIVAPSDRDSEVIQ